MFGKSSLYYLGHANARAAAAREIDFKAREHEKELEHILLKNSRDDCTRFKLSFDKKFKERFSSTIDNHTWLETAIGDTLADFRTTEMGIEFIDNWTTE